MMKIRMLIMSLMLVLALTLAYSMVAVTWAKSECKEIVGPKKIAVLLFDFERVKHTRTPDYYQKIIKDMNASYYRQSYGKMWLVGGEVYGWYETDLPVGQVTTWNVNWDDAKKLEDYALVKAGSLGIADRYLFAVYAGDVWAWILWARPKMTVIGENKWGLDAFMHEFGHQIGLPDLYNYFNLDAEPVGEWDLMDSGIEELSSWSRMCLGWIPQDSVLKTYSGREVTVFINSLDSSNGTRVMKVQLGGGSTRYLLLETRQTAKGLRLVIYRIEGGIESGKGSIVLETVMDPKKPVFLDAKMNAAFIILDTQTGGLSVRLAKQGEGERAQEAYDTTTSASDSIELAWVENRIQGLDEAKQELSKAWEAFHNADFDTARDLAVRARQSAQDASVPQSYSQVMELRQTLEAQIQNVSAWKPDAINYLNAAKNLIRDADDLIGDKDFDGALQKLQQAQKDLMKASEAEKAGATETQTTQAAISELPSYQLIIVAVVVVVVLAVAAIVLARRKKTTDGSASVERTEIITQTRAHIDHPLH